MKVINKIAFLVHEPTMFAHYSTVWAEMDRNTFVIVLLGVFLQEGKSEHGTKEFLNKVNKLGCEIVYLENIVANKTKYQYVVSNHIMGGASSHPISEYRVFLYKTKNIIKRSLNLFYLLSGATKRYQVNSLYPVQYLPLQAGIKQIRFMYGADISDAWSLDAWNEIYDLFLCHGPNDEMYLKKRFKGKTAIMGYPRYDGFFLPDLNVDDVFAEFAIDRTKQTILWMPTWDAFGDNVCSIPYFSKAIADLKNDLNIIVRPHPISFRRDPTGIELLESFGFKIDRDPIRDMSKLFKIADAVLCDHGGSAFGALYLGKRLVFLKTPNADAATVHKGSSNLELMKYFPVLEVEQITTLVTLLNDTNYWDDRLGLLRELSDKYFANYRGNSSQKTAEILANLNSIYS
jgi:CDP-glycerol glycerophosphotransferase (TagB/SpsB family)